MNLKEKTILVTGADGFIGSHLVEELVPRCGKVKALSLYNSFNHWGWLEDVHCKKDIEIICGDIRDSNFTNNLLKGTDVVFHLAALIAIPFSYIAPASYIDTNVLGTLNVCQSAQVNGCERVIITSTSEVYGTAKYVPIDEAHPLQPQSPYSASKIAADALAMSFYTSFDLPVTIARPFNTYGPRQSARAIIPSIITQIAAGSNTIRLGDTTPTRDLNYVRDICRGFILLAESDRTVGETVNIGSNTEISVKDLFLTIARLMNRPVELAYDEARVRPPKSEVFRLRCDNRKIRDLVDYRPEVTLEEGLKKTITWFTTEAYIVKYKSEIYNV